MWNKRKLAKEELINLILQFIKTYPQVNGNKINYTFAGSTGFNLLSISENLIVNKYKLEGKILHKKYSYKLEPNFKKFFRKMSDIDLDIHNKSVFKNIDFINKKSLTNFCITDFSNIFKKQITEVKLDCFKNTQKYATVYSISIKGIEIFVEDFKFNLGYRLKTFSQLPNERFIVNNEKYNSTYKKYSRDINLLMKIFLKFFGASKTSFVIKYGLSSLCNDLNNFFNKEKKLNELKLNVLLTRINSLGIKKYYKCFLNKLIEEMKIDWFVKSEQQDLGIFMLNEFCDVEKIDELHEGRSKAKKYIISNAKKKMLIKVMNITNLDKVKELYTILKLINKKIPQNTQKIINYGANKEINICYILYEYATGENLKAIKDCDYYKTGIQCGQILRKIHKVVSKKYYKNIPDENNKMKETFNNRKNIGIGIKNRDKILKFIDDNSYLLRHKKNCFLHNDFKMENIILSDNKIVVIDFDNCAKGNNIIDFKKIIIDSNKEFYNGLIRGYYNNRVPKSFFKELKFFVSLKNLFYMEQINGDVSEEKRRLVEENYEKFLAFFNEV